ncbi:ABC-type multidrug/protein/lipid transport system, ATPase component [Lachnospiraceae bacterium KM106-2]|nr:ABC-type multidrug/protein/lipid transport system, ATPase component [Lachnospiraceae bacterium KM106-2]
MSHKKKYIRDYIIYQKMIVVWIVVTIGVSFVAPLKNFILQWIIDSGSKERALKYLCFGILIICTSHILELLCRNLYTLLECKASNEIRNAVIHNALLRSIEDYEKQEDSAYISTLTTDMRTICDDYFNAIFNIIFFGDIMLCSLGMYAYISPLMLLVVVGISIVPILAPKFLSNSLRESRQKFSDEMKSYTQTIKELLGGFETIHLFQVKREYEKGHEKESKANADVEASFSKSLNKTIVGTSFISQ